MIIIDKQVVFSEVEKYLSEAKVKYDQLDKFLNKSEISVVIENMAKSEPELAIAIGSINESIQLDEFMVKHVSAKGELTKTKDRKTRSRQAFQTTGLTKSARRQIARKAAKTKRANPSGQVRAVRKRKRAMAKRKMFGLDN